MSDCFLANMAALWAADTQLAMALDRLADDERLATEPSRAGPPTARVAGADGVARHLHSRYDPAREAADQIDAAFRAAGHDHDAAPCYCVCGLGLGYATAELIHRLGAAGSVVAVERDLATLATALELHDYSAALRDRRLTFLTSADTAHCHERLRPHNSDLLAGLRFVPGPSADTAAADFHAAVRAAVADYVAFTRTAVLTTLSNNQTTVRNVSHNLGWYLAGEPLAALKGRLAGRPAVVVSAGPSLGRVLPRLKQVAGRVVVIAVQTALRPLLAAGIRPHFVTSLDYHPTGARFFQDLDAAELARVHLVAEPKAAWEVIDQFAAAAGPAARVTLLGNEFADRLLGPAAPAPAHDRLPAGATVAHLAFYLAQHLGCDPILFVGQDLGFSNGSYYTPGTAAHRAWGGELGRFNTLEMMDWQRIVRHRRGLRKLTDVHGAPIYTDEQMYTYLQQFQRDFACAPQRIIDATGGGVAKAGAEIMGFDSAAERFAAQPLPADRLAPAGSRPDGPARLAAAVAALERRIEQVAELKDICSRTLTLLEQLVGLLEGDPGAFNRVVGQVDEMRAAVGRQAEMYALVSQVSQLAEFHRQRADRSLRIAGAEGVEKRRIQLGRDRGYVAAIRDGCDRLTAILRSALERLQCSTQRGGEAEGAEKTE